MDFIAHRYPYINPPKTEQGISFLSMQDIAAMKLNTICKSGQRLKDFIDLYFLLEYYSLNQMLGFFSTKYPLMNILIPLKSFNYFEDVDETIDVPILIKSVSFDQVKSRLNDAVLHSSRIFIP